jgi:hypothetical protein
MIRFAFYIQKILLKNTITHSVAVKRKSDDYKTIQKQKIVVPKCITACPKLVSGSPKLVSGHSFCFEHLILLNGAQKAL